jgi:phage terminase large subunit-like protein
MLPNISNIENVDDLVADFEENVQEDTKTFAINTKTNNISGFVDGLDALIQSVYLMLNIEADQYIIYPYTYGVNTLDLIGKPVYYVEAVLPDRIKETLLSDDRITDVSDFEFTADKSKLHVKFIVTSIYGTFDQETVVSY